MNRTYSLDELSEKIDYGLTASASEIQCNAKFLRITDIQNNKVNWEKVPFVEAAESDRKKYGLQTGDIVFARTGATTGKSFLIKECPEEAVFASYLIRVRVKTEKIDPAYLSAFFKTPLYWNQINKNSSGSAQAGVNSTKLKTLEVPLPTLSEQKRIAAILDKADALREKRRQAIDKLDELLQSVFLDIFGDPVTNQKGWDYKELAHVVKKETIVTYGIVQAGKEFENGVPYIRTCDIVNGEIKTHQLRHTNPTIAAKFERSKVREGEIVMSIRATVGTSAMVPKAIDGANLTQGTARISPGKEVTNKFLLYFIRSNGTQTWLQQQIKGATFREITLTRLREMPVFIPPFKLQERFTEIVNKIEFSKEILRNQSYTLDALFASLQHRAFKGEL